jgi:hypothetical protein
VVKFWKQLFSLRMGACFFVSDPMSMALCELWSNMSLAATN